MKLLPVFVTIVFFAYHTKADLVIDSFLEDDYDETADLETCEERICSRVYSPICVSINGQETTLASMCHLANIRCELIKEVLRSPNYKLTDFRVLYFGECEENAEEGYNREENSENENNTVQF